MANNHWTVLLLLVPSKNLQVRLVELVETTKFYEMMQTLQKTVHVHLELVVSLQVIESDLKHFKL